MYLIKNLDNSGGATFTGVFTSGANTADAYLDFQEVKRRTIDKEIHSLYASGTFGAGATVKLQAHPNPDDSNLEWHDVYEWTAKGEPVNLYLDYAAIRISVTGLGATSDINVYVG